MPRLIIYPYKLGSGSAKELQRVFEELRAKRVRPDGNYTPFRNHFVLNWGNNNVPDWYNEFERRGLVADRHFINHPDVVKVASNKLLAFQKMQEHEVAIPKFTASKEEATTWWEEKGIMVRTLLRANSGRGAIYFPKRSECEEGTELPNAPLYVRYIKKQDEYRVHIFKGEVIDVQQKKKRREVDNDDVDYQIRNACNGWVFCRDDVTAPPQVIEQAKKAVEALGLDFGAADMLYNHSGEKAYCVEVNTAVGLEGQTLESYKNAITNWINS